MSCKTKIIFISSSISAVHIVKRVQALSESGYNIEVYAFSKGDKIKTDYPIDVVVHDLGFTSSGKDYFRRFTYYIPILKKIFKKNKNEDVIYFVSAFDLALITRFLSKKSYIYHISDIIYGYFPTKLLKLLFKSLDKIIIKKSIKTVVTSLGFTNYLSTKSTIDKFIYQPNNLSSYFESNVIIPEAPQIDINELHFAFVGFIRFASIFRFAEIIGKYFPQHKFFFFGRSHSLEKVNRLIEKYPNIEYKGEFSAPYDLNSIYANVDIVVSCYETSSLNVRLAEPNKLFEAIYFKRPIVVSSDTFLAKKVTEMKVGYNVDANAEENIISFINNLTEDSIYDKINNIEKIPRHLLIDDKSIQIVEAIREYLDKEI